MSDNPFHASAWCPVDGFANLTDITYHRHTTEPTVRVAFNRPEVRNAFRPHTVDELYRALDHARMSPEVGVVLLTGNGPSPKDGGWAFCAGGDQRIRGRSVPFADIVSGAAEINLAEMKFEDAEDPPDPTVPPSGQEASAGTGPVTSARSRKSSA